LNQINRETDQEPLKRAFCYAPNRPGTMASLAEAQGRELSATYCNPARFDGKLRIYLTLKCNLSCSYCVNEKIRGVNKKRTPAKASAWCRAINRQGRHVVFTGGEPFLYRELPQLINGIDPFLSVSIYSNLSFDISDALEKIDREVSFYVSWHAHQEPDRAIFLANAEAIRANPLFTLTAHAIEAHENQHLLEADLEFFRDKGVDIAVDVDQRDFDGCLKHQTSQAICRKRIYLICVCPDYGICAPCDGLGETNMGVLEAAGRMTKKDD